jgi:hypothetical protein
MTGTQKFAWGLILTFGGSGLLVLGVLLTTTIIGACVGVPIILAAIPTMIWGIVWAFQGQMQKQREAIALGVEQGIRGAQSHVAPVGEGLATLATAPAISERSEHQAVNRQQNAGTASVNDDEPDSRSGS